MKICQKNAKWDFVFGEKMIVWHLTENRGTVVCALGAYDFFVTLSLQITLGSREDTSWWRKRGKTKERPSSEKRGQFRLRMRRSQTSDSNCVTCNAMWTITGVKIKSARKYNSCLLSGSCYQPLRFQSVKTKTEVELSTSKSFGFCFSNKSLDGTIFSF